MGRMSPSQRHLFRNVLKTSSARARLILDKAALSNEQKMALVAARERIERSRIVVNLNLNEEVFKGEPMIESLLKSKRLYNVFEIAHAQMDINPTRLRLRTMLEFKIYGASTNVQTILAGMSNTEHPNFGVLDYFSDPIGISMLGTYGWYRFVLKENIHRLRCTFTPRDSVAVASHEVYLLEDIDAILATRPITGGKYWFEYVNDRDVPIDERGRFHYIETQILGGVFLADDVDVLCYPDTDQFKHPFFENLQRFSTEFHIELKPY